MNPEQMPTVSIIIPTCNRASLLARAMKSVLAQTFQDYEIIVVDDASHDLTEGVVKGFRDERISYLKHGTTKGGSAARNTGIRMARGEFIAFLDDDDEWLADKLEKQVHVLKDNSMISLVYTGYTVINQRSGKIVAQRMPTIRGNLYDRLLAEYCIGATSTIILKRECFAHVGLFDESLPSCQDWDMFLRLSKDFLFDFIETPLVRYYTHERRISSNYDALILGRRMFLDKYAKELATRKNVKSRLHLEMGNFFCHKGEMRKGRRELLNAISMYPVNVKYCFYYLSSLFGSNIYRKIAMIKRTIANTHEL